MWGTRRVKAVLVEPGKLSAALFTRKLDSLITPDRVRIYPRIFLAASLLGLTISSLVRVMDPTVQGAFLPDYLAHWSGGGLLLLGDSTDLYDPEIQHEFQKNALGTEVDFSWFVSPPFVAAFYAPLALLPYGLSGLVWLILSASLIVCTTLSLKSLAPGLILRKRSLVVIAVLASPVVFEILGSGQDSAFILAAWLAGIRLLISRHSFWAGAVLGLGLAKPQLVVLVPLVLLATRNYRALAAFVAVCALLMGISLGIVGGEGLYQWVATLSGPLYLDHVQQGQAWKMVGLPSLVQALLPPAWGSVLAPVLTTSALPVGAGILLLWLHRLRGQLVEAQAIWIATLATTATFSPHLATYDAVLFIPIILYLLQRRPSPLIRVASTAAFILLWMVPVLHLAAAPLPWPLAVIDAPWSAIPLALIWFESLKALQPNRTESLASSKVNRNSAQPRPVKPVPKIEGQPEAGR
ncbi:hypothetical protein QFZ40_000982 [Arthrobacter pascens]|uniref:glycosyltransferase family 87 protein n=1 Tax=Arthrobacter pascens TaxID=1677 RepID=UPI00278B8BE8|nr:glycosyltransferase family 87 protein [Arthrobacter pascens]MDQ0633073.1 hypothetical protein [Arthrobacter pascens]